MTDATIAGLLADHRTVVVAGSGGVGKTTVAAALGVMAARQGQARVLVLTVDPARRLATALGVGDVGGEPQFVDTGLRGGLWVAMLDAEQEWDKLIERHAPDERTRDAVLGNHLYRNITRRFVHSHEYAAMERLHQLQTTDEWDLIVLDTPPSRNALDLLDAPQHMRDFFGGRLLRWLTAPATSRFALQAFRPFRLVADRILGGPFVTDLTEFFVLIRTMEEGFVQRADEVEASLFADSTAFVLVTTPERGPVNEVVKLVDELDGRGCPMGAIVVNRATPRFGADRCERAPFTAADVDGFLAEKPSDAMTRVVGLIGETADQICHVRAAEAVVLESLPDRPPTFIVPMMSSDIADLEGVMGLAAGLGESSSALT